MGQGKLALHVMESKTTPAPITLTPIYTVNSLKSDTIVIIRLFNSSGTVARQYKFHPPVRDSINTTFSLAAKKHCRQTVHFRPCVVPKRIVPLNYFQKLSIHNHIHMN